MLVCCSFHSGFACLPLRRETPQSPAVLPLSSRPDMPSSFPIYLSVSVHLPMPEQERKCSLRVGFFFSSQSSRCKTPPQWSAPDQPQHLPPCGCSHFTDHTLERLALAAERTRLNRAVRLPSISTLTLPCLPGCSYSLGYRSRILPPRLVLAAQPSHNPLPISQPPDRCDKPAAENMGLFTGPPVALLAADRSHGLVLILPMPLYTSSSTHGFSPLLPSSLSSRPAAFKYRTSWRIPSPRPSAPGG